MSYPVGMWKIKKNYPFTTFWTSSIGACFSELLGAFEGNYGVTMSFSGNWNSGKAFRDQWYFVSKANLGKFYRGQET